MDFSLSDKQEGFRREVRSWLETELTAAVRNEMEHFIYVQCSSSGRAPSIKEFNRKLGAQGWLGMHWPGQYGGHDRSIVDQWIVFDELSHQWAVVPNYIAVGMVGDGILHHGSEEQKRQFLPKIARGEIEFALGYTEPEAGCDLASMEMTARPEGDSFIINGQKVFNTLCHHAEYHWLAARTDPTVPKHKGISLFIVDMGSPGISVVPQWTMTRERTNAVFYDNVRVPRERLVGEVNRGWYYMMENIDAERLFIYQIGNVQRLFDDLVSWVKEHHQDKNESVRQSLADLAARLKAARLLQLRALWLLEQKKSINHEVAMMKMYMTLTWQRLTDVAIEILGPYGQVYGDSKWVQLGGRVETGGRAVIPQLFGAGSLEIEKNIIATRGLGMPR